MKTCINCGVKKPAAKFHKDCSRLDGLSPRCKQCKNSYDRCLYQSKRDKILQRKIEYYQENRQKIKQYKQKRKRIRRMQENQRRKTDLNFKIRKNLRTRVWHAIKTKKPGSAILELGCTVEQLKFHLQDQFQPGMSWDNYGLHGWHIDHIKPLANFDLTNSQQFSEACRYTNLQPLWAEDNLRKNKS